MVSYRFLDFELDPRRYQLRRNGRNVPLEKIPMDLLILLLVKKGDLISREEIVERIWGKGVFVDSEAGVRTAIRKIRLALHDDPDNPRFIQTVVGRGYRFLAPIDVAEESSRSLRVAPASAAGSGPEVRQGLRSPHSWVIWATPSLLVALSLVLLGINGRGSRDWFFGRSRPFAIHSLAVLPLENFSRDPGEEYFADGMTDELITDLAQIGELRVVSRTSVMRFKDSRKPLPEIARELNVDAVVEGTVERYGNHLRVRAQLIRAADDRHLWAKSFEREEQDVVTLQGEIASAIAREIRVKLTPEENAQLARARALNPQAYQFYLKGRYFWNKWNEEGLKKSIEYFNQAIEKDPGYAQAWAGLSDAYDLLGDFGISPSKEALPKAKQAALKALSLDETLAEAHVSLGGALLHFEWSWHDAETELQRAIALDSNSAMAHQWYGYYLTAMGRFEDAIREMQRAKELDPLSANKCRSFGKTLYRAGRYDAALQQFREMAEFEPSSKDPHFFLAEAYERKKMYKEAVSEWKEGLRLASEPDLAALVEQTYVTSDYSEAKRVLLRYDAADLRQKAKRGYVSAYDMAADYAMMGEKNKSFEWLAKAFEARDATLIYLKVDNQFEDMRADPRFAKLLLRMNFPR
jgi:TolB-like protein/DNA-binding winged helix-turn-helix (wHTH) protein/Flp pilus assembly protein TadD